MRSQLESALSQARLTAAIGAAKVVGRGLRASGHGGGTAAPGLVATTIDPHVAGKIASGFRDGVVVVAGTNGKTTTSRILSDLLNSTGYSVVANRSGSNLMRGVAVSLAERAALSGSPGGDVAVIEADEAAFPAIVSEIAPRIVVLTNLFRDQLDRYGELNSIARKWRPVLEDLPALSTIVVNVDDPRLSDLTDGLVAKRVAYGIDPGHYALDQMPHAADVAMCPACSVDIAYREISIGHLGDWYCPGCGITRPDRDIVVGDIHLDALAGSSFSLSLFDHSPFQGIVQVPGLYNVYNVAAAVGAASLLGTGHSTIVNSLRVFEPPFGRLDRVTIDGKEIALILIKNPTGCNEVLRMLAPPDVGNMMPTMVVINDLDADGRDVSWIWDADFELLAPGETSLYSAGLRGPDMANRLKYAGVEVERIVDLGDDPRTYLYAFVDDLPADGEGVIVATYTATIALQKVLADDGLVPRFWDQ